jgi:hypothetical protein
MAKSRRNVSRKNRASRKNRKASRRNRRNNMMGGRGLFGTLYSPIGHLLQATGNTVSAVTNTTRNVAKRGLSGLNSVGRSVTGHANMAVRNVMSRKRRGGGRR